MGTSDVNTTLIKYDDTDTLGDNSGSAYVFKAKPSAVNPAIIMYLLN